MRLVVLLRYTDQLPNPRWVYDRAIIRKVVRFFRAIELLVSFCVTEEARGSPVILRKVMECRYCLGR